MSRKYGYSKFDLENISAYNMKVGGKMGFGRVMFV
jgi:hypothetical protein